MKISLMKEKNRLLKENQENNSAALTNKNAI